jgi:hypothetical protein
MHQTYIKRVGWLMVSDMQSLWDLDERRQERLAKVRRAAAKQRKR